MLSRGALQTLRSPNLPARQNWVNLRFFFAQSGFKEINVSLLFTISEAKQSCKRRYIFSDKFIAHIYRKSSRDFLVNLWFAIFIGTLIFCLTSKRKEGRKRNHELRVRHQWGKGGRKSS